MKTNLFIAGACKSGTSFLHDFLGQQTDICSSSPKEPYFFELSEDKRDSNAYHRKYFKHYKSEKVLVDSRHRNMFFSWIPKAISDYNSESKIIFILRNPLDRAFSHWWMWYSRKIISKNFHKTITSEIRGIDRGTLQMNMSQIEYSAYSQEGRQHKRMAYSDSNTVVESGYYYTQISRFKNYFKENQILILDFNEIKDIDRLSKKLEYFLQVEVNSSMKSDNNKNMAPEYVKRKGSFGKYFPKNLKIFIKKLLFGKPKFSQKS
jgi:hypothetical protein